MSNVLSPDQLDQAACDALPAALHAAEIAGTYAHGALYLDVGTIARALQVPFTDVARERALFLLRSQGWEPRYARESAAAPEQIVCRRIP